MVLLQQLHTLDWLFIRIAFQSTFACHALQTENNKDCEGGPESDPYTQPYSLVSFPDHMFNLHAPTGKMSKLWCSSMLECWHVNFVI